MRIEERRLGRSLLTEEGRDGRDRLLALGALLDEDRLLARGVLLDDGRGALRARGALRDGERLAELALAAEPEDRDPDDARAPSLRGDSARARSAGSPSRVPSSAADHQPARLLGFAATFHMMLLPIPPGLANPGAGHGYSGSVGHPPTSEAF